MMPSCDQIGVPIHFHSSTTSGSASLMSLRILLKVPPRQSPSSAILFEMSSDAGWPVLAADFFITDLFTFLSSPFPPNRSSSARRPDRLFPRHVSYYRETQRGIAQPATGLGGSINNEREQESLHRRLSLR